MENITRANAPTLGSRRRKKSVWTSGFAIFLFSIALFSIFYSLDLSAFFVNLVYAIGINDLKIINSAIAVLLLVFTVMLCGYRGLAKKLNDKDHENIELIRTLFEAKRKHKLLLESIADTVIVISHDWKILLANETACQSIFKAPREDFIGLNILEYFPCFQETKMYEALHNVMQTREADVLVESLPYGEKEKRWLEIRIYPVSEGVMTITIDITERILSEVALSESEYKYRQLFNGAYDAIAIIELVDGQELVFHEVNDFACKLLGYTREELLEISPYLIAVDSSKIRMAVEDVLKIGFSTFESTLISKENHLIPVEINAHLYMLQGKKYALTITRDLSDRKRVEAALLESEQRYRSLVDLSPDMITVEQDYKIVFANPATVPMLGADSIEEILGRPAADFLTLANDQRDRFVEQINGIFKDGRPFCFEAFQFTRHDGEVLDIEMASIPFVYNDRPAIQHICRDLSARKKVEEERKKAASNLKLLQEAREYDRLKTEFFSNISHEFKTPLNVILGTLQLCDLHLKSASIPPDLHPIIRYKNILKQNCYRLLRLINNLLDITKIDSGYFQIHRCNCDMVSLLKEITLSVADYVQNKKITFTFSSTTEQKEMSCDPDKIERIILNLLSNAIKFTNPGGTISVNFIDYGTQVEVVVQDTGIGIPEEKQSVIFERFRQVDPLLTRNHEGSGIGLSLVKSLVEMHQGTITLQSEVGKGSIFIINLPVMLLEEQPLYYIPDESRSNVEKIHIEFSDIYHI